MTTIFFFWSMAQVYRQLQPLEKKREHFHFYVPKIIPLLAYGCLRLLAAFQGGVVLSVIPFSNLIGLVASSIVTRRSFPKATIYVCVITAFELYVVSNAGGGVVADIACTLAIFLHVSCSVVRKLLRYCLARIISSTSCRVLT